MKVSDAEIESMEEVQPVEPPKTPTMEGLRWNDSLNAVIDFDEKSGEKFSICSWECQKHSASGFSNGGVCPLCKIENKTANDVIEALQAIISDLKKENAEIKAKPPGNPFKVGNFFLAYGGDTEMHQYFCGGCTFEVAKIIGDCIQDKGGLIFHYKQCELLEEK